MPVAPVVTSITFDHPSYAHGATITATVTYVKGLSDLAQTFTGVATDSLTGLSGSLVSTFTVAGVVTDATTPSASDAGLRTWSKTSDTGTVATFTATA